MENFEKLSSKEQKHIIEGIIENCREIAKEYIQSWSPELEDKEVVDGCAYLRLSTDKQVAREKGSLEQQIHIAISEAANRSRQDRVNYRVTHFFIEPGITGRHANRPQFQKMKACIKKGTYKFVLIKELSRISRDAGVWKEFFKTCQKNECQILIRNFPPGLAIKLF